MKVEITYLDGVQEVVENIPTARMAADIFAEAVGRDRVRSAVLYHSDGEPAQTYRVARGATSGDGRCGALYQDAPGHACRRVIGHPGRHTDMHHPSQPSCTWNDDPVLDGTRDWG